VAVSNVWDAAGRLAEVRHGDVPVLGLAYRADGLPLAASNASASVSWQYDSLGRRTSETAASQLLTPNSSLLTHSYDSSALATNASLSVGSWTLSVERSFDPAERLASLSSPAGTFSCAYGGTNGLPFRVSNSALTAESAYDILNRMTNTVYRDVSATVVGSYAYAYDGLGLVTQKVSVLGGAAATNAYAYDALGRLTVEVSRGQSAVSVTTNAYDLAGNRLAKSGTGVPPVEYAYTNNRLVSVGDPASAVLYDASGNVTNMTRGCVTLALAWNSLGQLVTVCTNGAFAESYAYDPLGRRVSTTTGGATVFHVYDGDHCVADLDASGDPLRSYTWGAGVDNLLAVTVYGGDATNSYYAIKDHLGTVHALADASGAVVASYTYDAWGSILSATINYSLLPINFSCRYLFQGREYSEATGLTNFRARWYAPELGRWLSPDPIGLEGGLNLYEFCDSNPLNFRDPDGLFACEGYEYWMDVAVAGHDRGGIVGNLQAAGASGMTSFIDFWGARTLQGNAERSGSAAGEGRTGAAIGYGTLAVGQIALEAVAVGGAMESAKYSTKVATHGAHHTFNLFGKKLKLPHIQFNFWKKGIGGSGKSFRIPLPPGSSGGAAALIPGMLYPDQEDNPYNDDPCN
jgi:RHS repeat-associated protein